MSHSLRKRITKSDATLAMSLIVAVCIWMAGAWALPLLWGCLALALLTAYCVLEMNNRCHLMRERSRMMSSVFLLIIASFGMLHTDGRALTVALTISILNYRLLVSYQQKNAVWPAATAFMMLGISICLFPPLILLTPFIWFGCHHHIQILTRQVWRASLLGLITPFIYALLYMLWKGIAPLDYILSSVSTSSPLFCGFSAYPLPPLPILVSSGALILLALWSIAHFGRTSNKNNTRTRLSLEMLTMEFYFLFLLAALFPQDIQVLMAAILVVAAPLIGHYVTLADGRLHDFAFWLWTLVFIALGVLNKCNLWNIL